MDNEQLVEQILEAIEIENDLDYGSDSTNVWARQVGIKARILDLVEDWEKEITDDRVAELERRIKDIEEPDVR